MRREIWFAMFVLCAGLLAFQAKACNDMYKQSNARQAVSTTPVGSITGIIGATGKLSIDFENCWFVTNEAGRIQGLGNISTDAHMVRLPENVLINLNVLKTYVGRKVTVVATIEYGRHEEYVFKPIRTISIQVFPHLNGLPKVVTE